jgi:uncharacterized protein (TIGR02145 family)
MKKVITFFFVLILSLSVYSQTKIKPVFGTFTDARDNKTYKTVTIGNQTWLASNLNYKTAGSWCYYDSARFCKTFGRLYSLEAARKACPAGWHLPSSDEWLKLVEKTGGKSIAGGYMKEAGFDHWKKSDVKATNASGFKALPGGYKDALSNNFFKMGEEAVYWSSTNMNNNEKYGWSLFLQYSSNSVFIENITLSDSRNGYSVRCIKNSVTAPKI